jgi:citrate synthase
LRKQHGEQIVGQIRVNDAILGMRGLKAMFYDGSNLDSNLGITFRGHVIPDFCRNAQRAPNG